jgi:hypothetical protein
MYPLWQAGSRLSRTDLDSTEGLLLRSPEALENVAFTSMRISDLMRRVLDRTATPQESASLAERCLDLRNTVARECLVVRAAHVAAIGQPERIAA